MIVNINDELFQVNENEFTKVEHKEYFNLNLLDRIGILERIVSLINDLSSLSSSNCIFYGTSHGGYIPIKCSMTYTNITIINCPENHKSNILSNIKDYNISNITLNSNSTDYTDLPDSAIIYSANSNDIDTEYIKQYKPIIITTYNKLFIELYDNYYQLTKSNLYLYIPNKFIDEFNKHFHYYIKSNTKTNILTNCPKFNYDNLINLCIIVKNGGELFKEMLKQNIDIIDRWTILDTGSTDGTIDVINRILVGKKKGELYQEPFINFRESRNRCLDLAGTQCKFNVMLDDTYCVNDVNKFLEFMNIIRNDQAGNSFSIFIKSHDVEYYSNRITKSQKKLRYIYKLHEIIYDEAKYNIGIPIYACFIKDLNNDYMLNRTEQRKENDLKCLFEMIEEEPDNPRHIYYVAQSYKLTNYEKAVEYYYKRAFHKVEGFEQEKFDALFEYTRISIYNLNKPFEEYKHYYDLCNEWQPERPEGNYFLGIGYYLLGDKENAYNYLKKAFKIGFPFKQQHSVKPTISYKFIPYYMAELCYLYKDYNTGLENTTLYLQKNTQNDEFYAHMTDWHKIYMLLTKMTPIQHPIVLDKPVFCFIADGGFEKWTGKDILTKGVGGSETWVIEMARYVKQLTPNYDVYVFCNCEKNETFEEVKYVKLDEYLLFISSIKVEHCIISRFSEYIPVSINSHIENIHVILHDIQLSGNIIPVDPKIKNVFCLTNWHKQLFLQKFPQFTEITHALHYGIDFTNFLDKTNSIKKIPYSFIYSSFPNRGLITVLKMWPKIQEKYAGAVLNIFTDINNKWSNTYYPEELNEIKAILQEYKIKYSKSVINHGWTDKKTLAKYWKQTHIWFYPCKFEETFCLTALEAAITKTLVISNDLAGLKDTVGERGVVIPGDSTSEIWQIIAFSKICQYLDNPELGNSLIWKNYEWALTHSWKDRASDFLHNYITNNITTNITTNNYEGINKELNYEQMYNWTNDLPYNTNAKITFEKILGRFTNYLTCNILEIGTYVGTSVIGMLQYLPNANATTIDMWKNYEETNNGNINNFLSNIEQLNVEKTFYKNIKQVGLTNKITTLKGDSYVILLDLIKQNKKYDFIYVDGSHKCIDCYTDCILSWQLLNKNGVLAIDDYLWKSHEDDVLDKPYYGINHFLEKINGQYILLEKGYRLFLLCL